MNPEIKAKWVAALRSGEYKQAPGALRSDDGFCCFGVACDLHAKEFAGAWEGYGPTGFIYQNRTAMLPDVVIDWMGLDSWNVVIHGRHVPLAEHNDSGRTFAEIADAIEGQL